MSKSISLRPENPGYFASQKTCARCGQRDTKEEGDGSVVGAFGRLLEVPDLWRLARRGTLGPREGNLLGLVLALHGAQPRATAAGLELNGPAKHNAVRE
jgi:hypothetical protein